MTLRARLSASLKKRVRAFISSFAAPEMTLALRQLQHRSRMRAGGASAPFPPRNRLNASELRAENILVLAPHPDDELIGLGGVIARHLEAGSRVTVLYLTDGRGPVLEDTSLVQVRREEARQIGKANSYELIFWDIPDTHLQADDQTVTALVGVLESIHPDSIFLTSFFDHQYDHFAANQLLAAALKRMPAADPVIYGYEVWDNIPFPNYFVDISGYFERKAEMLAGYRVPNEFTDFVELCRHRAALHYLLAVDSARREPEGYAEAFYRLDGPQFRSLFNEYEELLRKEKSPLIRDN